MRSECEKSGWDSYVCAAIPLRIMAWRPTVPPMRHDMPRVFGMSDRAPMYGAPSYAPPYTNVFRPPGVPAASQFIAPSRPVVPHASASSATSSSAASTAASASSSAKAAEALAQQQAADDKKRGYPTIKGKSVAQCKRKTSGTEELKVCLSTYYLICVSHVRCSG
jgi:hypothetical protein